MILESICTVHLSFHCLLEYTIQQYNTKSLFRNGDHQPIIQNSHNTILMMTGKLEFTVKTLYNVTLYNRIFTI